MSRWVIDTNVPLAANIRIGSINREKGEVSAWCSEQAIEFLQRLLKDGHVLLDSDGQIIAEYEKHFVFCGQPGPGDRFFQMLKQHQIPTTLVDLPVNTNGEYQDLPDEVAKSEFDHDDRKFAAVAAKESVPVAVATDSDWLEHEELLDRNGIRIEFVCGCDPKCWHNRG